MKPPKDSVPGMVQKIVTAGGSGDASDVAAVAAEVAKFPAALLRAFLTWRVKVVACRDSVTDFERSLRGVVPRGWEGLGRTWDSVPGTFLQGRRSVVIATIDEAGARRVTPRSPTTHGSYNLALHEAMHGHDYMSHHAQLGDPAFVAARTADFDQLGVYERQPGGAGLEETYAESAARYYGGDPDFPGQWPRLAAYWAADPLAEAREAPVLEGLHIHAADAPIGTAEVLPNGDIVLYLRADGPGGAVGHGAVVIAVDDPNYRVMRRRLFPEDALERVGPPQPVLVRPF